MAKNKDQSNNFLYGVIIMIIVIIIIIFFMIYKNLICEKDENFDEKFNKFIESHRFYNEKNELIDHKTEEVVEQYQCFKFIKPEDVVLELGGRYGSVSVVINKLVNDKQSHVVVEPDQNIIPSLTKNRELNSSQFKILPKFVSNKNKKIVYDSYGTRVEDTSESGDSDKKISYDEFKKMYPQRFNVLVADCEGCLCDFLDMMGTDFNHLKTVIFEADQTHMCDYNKVRENLIKSGFKEVDSRDNFRYVYMRA